MTVPTSPLLLQAIRQSAYRTTNMRGDRIGAFAAFGYCCAVITAPLAGAYLVTNTVAKDQRFSSRTLSFRDCLPGSPLDDYSGALSLRSRGARLA